MSMRGKEKLLTEEDLDEVTQHRFYISMSLRNRLKVRDNMEELKEKYDLSQSAVLRKVMLEFMNDEEFLKYIGVL